MKPRNFVAKHMNDFNHATIEVDRKKEIKRARREKHKRKYYEL